MLTPKSLVLLGFLGLMTGCVTTPCSDPDAISEKWVPQCLYHLTVTHVDTSTSTVTAKVPDALNLTDPKQPAQIFKFRVHDLAHLKLEEEKEYYFIRQGSSPYLDPYYGTPKGIYQYKGYEAGK